MKTAVHRGIGASMIQHFRPMNRFYPLYLAYGRYFSPLPEGALPLFRWLNAKYGVYGRTLVRVRQLRCTPTRRFGSGGFRTVGSRAFVPELLRVTNP